MIVGPILSRYPGASKMRVSPLSKYEGCACGRHGNFIEDGESGGRSAGSPIAADLRVAEMAISGCMATAPTQEELTRRAAATSSSSLRRSSAGDPPIETHTLEFVHTLNIQPHRGGVRLEPATLIRARRVIE